MSITKVSINAESVIARAAIQKMERQMNTAMSHISTGNRLTSSGDDPSSIAIYQTQRANLSGLRAAQTSAQEGIAALSFIDSQFQGVMDKLVAMRDLAVRTSSSSIADGSSTRSALATEFATLKTQIANLKTGVTFNGKAVFSQLMNTSGLNVQVGTTTNDAYRVTYAGLSSTLNFSTNWGRANIASAVGSVSAVAYLDTMISNWAGVMAKVGTGMNTVNIMFNELQAKEANIASVVQAIGDADMAQEITDYTRMQVIANAATSMLAQANTSPQSLVRALLG